MKEREDKASINPAARRDRPHEPEPTRDAPADEPRVEPGQDQPLDPLSPGGIGR